MSLTAAGLMVLRRFEGVGGSFSRSSLNRLAGATSAWAGAITGAFVLLAVPFTPALHDLPEAVLGAVVIGAVLKLVDLRGVWRLRRDSGAHLFVGGVTLVATLATAPRVERGVLVGIVVSFVVERVRKQRFEQPTVHEPVGK